MTETDSTLIDLVSSLVTFLAPVLVLMSLMLTIFLILRNAALRDLRHVSALKWIMVVSLIFVINFIIIFAAFYFYGYVLSSNVGERILALYIPVTLFVQGAVQTFIMKAILKPRDIPDNKNNRNKKFIYALGGTMPILFMALYNFIDLDPQSSLIYFIAPVLIALPLLLVYVYFNKINK